MAAADPELGQAFTAELICGGWFWPRLARAHHCFVIRGGRVEVLVGVRVCSNPSLAEQAAGRVLPLARAALAKAQALRRQQVATLENARASAWCRRWLARHEPPHAVAGRATSAANLFVAGHVEQPEAEALVGDLADAGLWNPESHGETLVWCGTTDVQVYTQHPVSVADLIAYVRGFCEWVVVSDLHLGLPHRDTFGSTKARDFCVLLDRVIQRRSVLILNGDFLELLHERYGAIKRAYPEIFTQLARVRRIIYVAGNHDADILRDRIKQTRRSIRRVALRHIYAEVRVGLDGELWLEARPGIRRLRLARGWTRLLRDPAVQEAMMDWIRHRGGRVFLSHGFAAEGVAFHRLGPRDTPAEQPHWILDESLARRGARPQQLLKLLADRRQRLDRVLQADWGGRVEIVRHYWNPARGVYFEHGHAAIPACHADGVGRLVSLCAGWLKRCGLRRVEHWFEEDLGDLVRAVHPLGKVREQRLLLERMLAVATWLCTAFPESPAPLMVCGHTHEAAHVGEGAVHTFLAAALGARYANSGAWSSRLRRKRPGADRSEWLVIGLDGLPRICTTGSPRPD